MENVTSGMRRYAAEIYRLQEHQETVSISALAEHIPASTQAISRMVARLKAADLIIHKPYQGVRLTESGVLSALPALRRHRLVEVFLVRVMGFGWDEVHEISDQFELGINHVIEDRIDQLAGFPTRCPHGEPIPSRDGIMPDMKDISLVKFSDKAAYCLSRVRVHEPAKLRYLGELGLVPGKCFYLTSIAPFNGPVRIQVDQNELVLGYDLSAALWVEPSPN
jgi:DtxR family Mn-dependent transcriptional regulator